MIGAGLAVGLLALDSYVLSPLMDRYGKVQARRDELAGKVARAQGLLQRRQSIERRWRGVIEKGMMRDAVGAESQAMHAVKDWAARAGLRLTSLRPERSTEKTPLPEIQIHVACTGRMESMFRLLWGIRTAEIPLKIRRLQLASRKEGTDDLSLQLRVSTLYLPENEPAPQAGPGRDKTARGPR